MSKLAIASNEMLKENSVPACDSRPPELVDREVRPVSNLGDPQEPGISKPQQPRLRVLHVIDRLGMGGTEVGILKVIKGLGSEGFEHRICTIRGFDDEFRRAHGFESQIYVAGRQGSGFQLLLGRLAQIMRDFRPDIVHSRNWGAIEAMPAARISRAPVAIHSEHGYEVDMLNGLPMRRRIFRRFAYAAADAVFTVTEELRGYHARQAWVPLEQIRVLPNGVDISKFARRTSEREASRRRLGFNEKSIVLGAVGRLVPIKNQGSLLRAAEILIGRGMSVHVLLVGSGPELPKLKEMVALSPQLSGRVVFEAATSDVPALLNAMDVFVLPSLSEGMSNTLLEAMASSLPVVATRVGGNPELVEDERSGMLFNPGDITNLSTILERLASNSSLRDKLSQEARNRVAQQFSLETMTGRYRNLYVELARKRGVLAARQG